MATASLALAAAIPMENNGVNLRVDTSDEERPKPMSKSKLKRLKARVSGRHNVLRERQYVPVKKSSSLEKMLGSKGRK